MFNQPKQVAVLVALFGSSSAFVLFFSNFPVPMFQHNENLLREVNNVYKTAKINLMNIYSKFVEEEMNILWKMCLQVHHLDGNHFNNDPKNLVTICPNVHSMITMYNQDYNNRYPELHAAIKKVAKKKGVAAPKALAFKLNW